MSYYRECPHCGANLDPGERCFDCTRVQKKTAPELEPPKAASETIRLNFTGGRMEMSREDEGLCRGFIQTTLY